MIILDISQSFRREGTQDSGSLGLLLCGLLCLTCTAASTSTAASTTRGPLLKKTNPCMSINGVLIEPEVLLIKLEVIRLIVWTVGPYNQKTNMVTGDHEPST